MPDCVAMAYYAGEGYDFLIFNCYIYTVAGNRHGRLVAHYEPDAEGQPYQVSFKSLFPRNLCVSKKRHVFAKC